MKISDEDDEHEEEGKNERQNESENGVILGTIQENRTRDKIGPRKSFSPLFQGKTIFFKWGKMIFPSLFYHTA